MNEDKCKSSPLITENAATAPLCLQSYSRALAPLFSRIKSAGRPPSGRPSKNLENRFSLGFRLTTMPESTFRYACRTQLFISSTTFLFKKHRSNSNLQTVQKPSFLLRLHFTGSSAAVLGARSIKNAVKTCVWLYMLRIELNVISHNIEQYQFNLKARLKGRKNDSNVVCRLQSCLCGWGWRFEMRIGRNGTHRLVLSNKEDVLNYNDLGKS